MNWLFWKDDRQAQYHHEIKQVADQVAQLRDKVSALSEGTEASLQQLEEFGGQLTKLARVQYKSGQETQANLEQLRQGLAEERRWQAESLRLEAENDLLTQQRGYLIEVLLNQLDEMDAVCVGLQAGNSAEWRQLLEQWSQRVITTLIALGIFEIAVVGKSFDPQLSEGMGAIPRDQGSGQGIPYEVASVIRRGFANDAGIVLRKAQVITYLEERHD